MMIKKRGWFEIVLPILIIGFIGQQSSLVTTVFSTNSRWILLLIIFSYIFFYGKFLQGLGTWLKIALFFYLSWCVFTVFWSEVPTLSYTKVGAMLLISITLASSGILWVKKFQWQNSLNWLILLLMVTLFTGFLGRGNESSINTMNGFDAYQGLANNTNYFGCLLAMNTPLLLWQIYQNRSKGKKQLVWCGLFIFSMIFLIQSYSRSAMLMVTCVLIFFILSVDIKKKLAIGSVLAMLVGAILFSFSLSIDQLIYKNQDSDLWKSRRFVWAESYNQAAVGGWTGGGFGVTIGDSEFNLAGLGSGMYGREKSNSQLGIIEETGLIGFGFYCLFLAIFFQKTVQCYRKLRGEEKVMMGLVLGAILGIVMESFFEAWWDAPASPEAIYFWMLFGVSAGLMRALNANRKLTKEHE